MKQITNNSNLAKLLLRLAFGGAMIYGHGLGKLDKLFAGGEIAFADPFGIGAGATLGLAVFSEVLCAGLIVLGLFTRWATIPLIITMGVAFFVIHISDPFGRQEMSILYGIAFIAIFLLGPGKWSLDHQLRRDKF